MPEKEMPAKQSLPFLLGSNQTHKFAPAELLILLRRIICSLIRPEKQMPALPSLAFLLVSLYHEFATQESLLSCAEFMNDKIIEHKVRQMQRIWILELLYHIFKIQER